MGLTPAKARRAALALLLALAVVVPGPLYLMSLAVLGLPHVVWELAFLRSRYQGRWPGGWVAATGAVLLVQLSLRAATWLGAFSPEALQVADLLALLLLMAVVAVAPAGWAVRSAALLVGVAVMAVLQAGCTTEALLLLALAHNFTPVGLAWNLARDDPRQRALARRATAVFLLPVAVVALGAAGLWPAPWVQLGHGWLATAWGAGPAAAGGALAASLASAMVLAQCLHYDWVLRVLPAAEHRRTGRAPMPAAPRHAAVAASAALALYFVWDFAGARQLYAVAAGLHAWLEWPVLLLVLLAPGRRARATPRPAPSVSAG